MSKEKKYHYFSIVFKKELEKWLKEHNAQKKEFAIDLKINPNMISRYLNGTDFPRADILQRMADMFGIDKEKFTTPSMEYFIDVWNTTPEKPQPIQLKAPYKAIQKGNDIEIVYPDSTKINVSESEYNALLSKIYSYADFLFYELKNQK